MKKLLHILLFAVISSQAQIIDAIAIDVNGEHTRDKGCSSQTQYVKKGSSRGFNQR